VIFGPTPHAFVPVNGYCQTCPISAAQQYGNETSLVGQYPVAVSGSYAWTHNVDWTGCPSSPSATQVVNYVTSPGGSITWVCPQYPQTAFPTTPGTVYQNLLPTTVSVATSTSDGEVNIIDGSGTVRYTTSVSPGTVSFVWPVNDGSGHPFQAGEYVITVDDGLGSNPTQVAYAPVLMASESTAIPSPFGVAPATSSTTEHIGVYDFGRCIYSNSSSTDNWPVVTSYSTASVYGDAGAIPVGQNPTAVATYGTATVTRNLGGQCDSTATTTLTGYAVVTNSGANTVSIVSLANNSNVASVTVGHAPVAVAVDPAGSTAYVANYDDATISVVSLGAHAQTNLVSVGAYPAAVAMDPSGASFWVGGDGYIDQFSTSSLALEASYGVGGFVSSLAVSQGQGEIFYTVAATSGGVAAEAQSIGSHQVIASYSFGTQPVSGCWGCGGPTDPPLQANSTLVSNILNNGLAVGATPNGFALVSLMSNQVIFQGGTPNPVRGIAVMPSQNLGWVTVPDSNQVLTIPISPNS